MDNQTKILVNMICERMQTVDKSIDDKSNKLFKIRDELASLYEQTRMMQYEINQLSTKQAENMSEFLLLCEHLDTYPKHLKGNIIPNMAGDVPLAPGAKNIYIYTHTLVAYTLHVGVYKLMIAINNLYFVII
ncbi:hypothetical protein H5410_056969 [Solanum commersonii]|uniref:Uncharacterized protein n=1 Tax=Solanum commersonii TaxID=4109 RepID=A0A9J5WLP4_SOLCO|nr:hypothetical protein H5410_056969 [Solanum commersonii]